MTEEYDVIVIGAGVVGPCIATALARQGRSVLIIERDWSRPDRIVGELMQPAGIKALKELGMINAINDINAVDCTGYFIQYYKDQITIGYPYKDVAQVTNPVKPLGKEYKLRLDSSINVDEWEKDERVRGAAFHHGDFLQNLRSICKAEPNVTAVEGTVTKLVREFNNTVVGVSGKRKDGNFQYRGKLIISCDGIYSKFRTELGRDNVPLIGSYFVGFYMEDAKLPAPGKGHVLLGDHAPVLIYQVSPTETRVLCAFRSNRPPSAAKDEIYNYLKNDVLPAIPKELYPAFEKGMENRKYRVMPNQFLSAKKNNQRGLICIGDSLNMRHPLTGGGMTVGLNDAVLLARLLDPKSVEDLDDYDLVQEKLTVFHRKRKNLDAVINTLSIALYSLFAADRKPLQILQRGCFKYFQRGGDCVDGPIGLLSGVLPFPMLLFNHFFSVAFYSIYLNFIDRGIMFPLAIWEGAEVLYTAVTIFTPYLWKELVQ